MTNATLIGSAEACAVLGVDKSTLSRWVAAGVITPAHKNPGKNGAFLFERQAVNALCIDRGAAKANT